MTDLHALEQMLQTKYGVAVDRVIQMKSVLGIVGVDGQRWIWKLAGPRDTEGRLAALSEVTNRLERSGVFCAGPVPALGGHWLVALQAEGKRGYLQPWFGGRHIDLSNRNERLAAIVGVAELHRTSTVAPVHLVQRLGTSDLSRRLHRKQQGTQDAWPIAKRHLPQLQGIETLLWAQIRRVVDRVTMGSAPGNLSFCHRDLAPHNILYQSETAPSIAFVDLDTAGYDQPYLDLMQLCNHSIYFAEVEPGYFHEMMTAYKAAAPLSQEQEEWAWELFCFPDLLIRSTIEWVAKGCQETGKSKVLLAAQKEQQRRALLQQEAPWLKTVPF